ncbi:UDP-glucose 4-epimerase [Arsukibacterium ikkense]|uniref:UDP-glucose 4-epimerase n=1 Tax=Arsukibacterium ikkense TaxID=336831 RepID=A0A0M2V963_9GAMM|nr:SDR family oxidoreductase [Arsukibacterium ikkense]KKO46979.1 UDP-glucose 4-epimerase [Arsukibacterium ikkense]
MSGKVSLLISGASGFVGKQLLNQLTKFEAYTFNCAVRAENSNVPFPVVIRSIDTNTNWSSALEGKQVVLHMAGRAHIMRDDSTDPLTEYRKVNVAGTLNLARQAAASGVKRFIFISSVKVNGEATAPATLFKHDDEPQPQDFYGVSKAEAEAGLKQLAAETGMEIVIIRPPLVYGPGVKANFATMLKWAQKNLPLPFGAIHNRRSMVALDNLVDLIITCISHPNAANQTFLVSDDQDISTTELLQMMTRAAGKKPRLLPVPVSWLKLAGKLTGKQAVIDRLSGNLQVDIEHTKNTLSWSPPVSVEEGIKRCFTKEDLC